MTIHYSIRAWMCAATVMMSLGAELRGDSPTNPAGRKVEIVGHRGESYDAPENTLGSMNLAWARGADGVEMDLHLTKDGQLITCHDFDTYRVTGGDTQGGTKKVIVETTAEELRKLDVGRWKAPPWAGEKMPLVEEVLATLPKETNRRLFIEVKVGPNAAAPLIAAIKKAGHPAEQTAVISFKLDTCAEVKKLMPELKVYYLADFKTDKKTGAITPTIDDLITQAKAAKLDGLDLSYKGPIDAAAVEKVHDAGLSFYAWTVDEVPAAKKLIEAGVDGLTTNRAMWLREQLKSPEKH